MPIKEKNYVCLRFYNVNPQRKISQENYASWCIRLHGEQDPKTNKLIEYFNSKLETHLSIISKIKWGKKMAYNIQRKTLIKDRDRNFKASIKHVTRKVQFIISSNMYTKYSETF